MSEASRLRELTEAGLLHANPAAVVSPLFTAGGEFFLAADKVQLKYEMLRSHLADGLPVGMMLVAKAFDEETIYRAAAAFESRVERTQRIRFQPLLRSDRRQDRRPGQGQTPGHHQRKSFS